jgi:ERCC4-type nuclease
MASYPVQILKIGDLQRVPSIGPTIAKRLGKLWKDMWGELGGPEPIPGFIQPSAPIVLTESPKKKRKKVLELVAVGGEASQEPVKKKRVSKKPYCPEYRSGSYALLIALYTELMDPPKCNWMNKTDLINKAQQYCNASFAEPKDNTSAYKVTAWKSMSTLVDKDLVWKSSNPFRYGLTEAGEDLAKILWESSQGGTHSLQSIPSLPSLPSLPSTSSNSSLPSALPNHPCQSSLSNHPSQLRLPNDISQSSLSNYPTHAKPKSQSFKIYHSDDDLIDLTDDPEFKASKPPLPPKSKFSANFDEPPALARYRAWSNDHGTNVIVLTPRKVKRYSDDYGASDVELASSQCAADSQESVFEPFGKWAPIAQTMTSPVRARGYQSSVESQNSIYTSDSQPSKHNESQPFMRNESQGSLYESQGMTQSSASSLTGATRQLTLDGFQARPWHGAPFMLKAGSFDIVMILDKREKKSHRNDAGYIANRLGEKGVKVDCRVLELGDVLWIAREKSGEARTAREIVLDYVIERKAIDDLRSSIFEGRFDEQRTRLNNCGLFQVSFLVEGFIPKTDTIFTGEKGEHTKSIQSAMALLQVRSGFFVKQTSGLEHTLDYLQQMTTFITQLHEVCCF